MNTKILSAKFYAWLHNSDGATAVEYGILAGAVGLAIVTALFALGGDLTSLFETLESTASDANAQVETS